MKISFLTLIPALVGFNIASHVHAASSAMTLRNLEDGNRFKDSSGVDLDAGVSTVNGDGDLVQLGYFSTNTASFEGTWNVVYEFRIGDFYLQSGSSPVPDGEFLARAEFDDTSPGLPASDTQMAMRFYDGTDTATSNYNTVTHSEWKFLTPADPTPSDRDFDVNDGSGTLVWQDGGANAFKTTITPVPEPSSAALLGLGMTALLLRRRK